MSPHFPQRFSAIRGNSSTREAALPAGDAEGAPKPGQGAPGPALTAPRCSERPRRRRRLVALNPGRAGCRRWAVCGADPRGMPPSPPLVGESLPTIPRLQLKPLSRESKTKTGPDHDTRAMT
jgi:hypothetical protein